MKDFSEELIAPCGINCRICRAYMREKNKCPGCREPDINKPATRVVCKIKICDELKSNNLNYCIECKKFPCESVKHLDKRYSTKYNMSVIENLESIKENGINIFLQNQEKRYKCLKCGGVFCVHNRKCYTCSTLVND
jgi:hypothetical protein